MRCPATTRTALPLLLAGGLALSACSFGGGVEGDATSATPTRTTPAGTSTGTTSTPAASSTPSAGSSSTSTATSTAPAVTAAPESPEPEPTRSGGPDRCHTSELGGSLQARDAAAGNRYATLVLTNTGGEVCTVYGYGGLGLVGPDGGPVPSTQQRVASPQGNGGSRTTLQPGQAVAATLRWTVVATGPEPTSGDCEPTPGRLTVIPPDETDSLSITWPFGPVCSMGQIEQTPYAAA